MFADFVPYAGEVYSLKGRVFALVRANDSGLAVRLFADGAATLGFDFRKGKPSACFDYADGGHDTGERAMAWIVATAGLDATDLSALLLRSHLRLAHVPGAGDDAQLKARIDREIRATAPEGV